MREMGEKRRHHQSRQRLSGGGEALSRRQRSFGKVNRNQHELNYKAGQEGGS